jgi:hypothetical protein
MPDGTSGIIIMNLPWPFESWRELALTAVVVFTIVVVVGLFFVRFPYPYQASLNFGLGADWHCGYPLRNVPVCIKDIPKK